MGSLRTELERLGRRVTALEERVATLPGAPRRSSARRSSAARRSTAVRQAAAAQRPKPPRQSPGKRQKPAGGRGAVQRGSREGPESRGAGGG